MAALLNPASSLDALRALLVVWAFWVLAPAPGVAAQGGAAAVPIPAAEFSDSLVSIEHPASFDSTGRIERVPPGLRRRLGLFPTFSDFVGARLWRRDDGRYIVEVEYQPQGRLTQWRQILTPAGLDSLRAPFDRYLATRRGNGYDHSGRGELIFDSIVLSLAVYGPSAPVVLGIRGSRPGLAAYMLTSSGGFYVPYRLTRHRDVTRAHRQLTQYGATRGFIGGFVLKHLILGGGGYRANFRFANATSVAGALTGFGAVSWRGYSRGQSELVGVMGDFGLATGGCLAHAIGWYGDDTRRAGDALVLASAGAGLWLGQRLGQYRHYTRGDAYILRAGGVAGAIATLPFVDAFGTSSDRVISAALMAGGAAGVVFTDRLMVPRDFTFGEGLIVSGGELAGALLCMGLTYLADTGGDFDSLAYTTAAAAGSTGGFALTFRMLTPR
ncbi:MAG: hypothetical protein HN712_16315 [Gemmatimonadetes bacterium]|jgi:hypothetical protein|nr:hypothetical protein [Gemmatimonadota bacterium]MBT6144248.1 hypothetical protein [Gemmatimonadota bacterium]MBT7861880.1 hypothetical protein [Gemmatimonadota bacterium]